MDWKQVATILAIIGTVFTGGYWGWQKLLKPILDFLKRCEKIEAKANEVDEVRGHSLYVSKKLDALLQLSDYAIFVCNDAGLCVLANEAICELFGASEYGGAT